MATATQKATEKWKNKKWFNIYTPEVLGGNVISEVPAADEKSIIGRVIKVSLSWITQNPAHSFMTVGLRVKSAEGNSAHTDLDYLEETYSYIHSLVRRFSSAIYTVDKLSDKNKRSFVLKLLIVTRDRVATPKKTLIRHEISKYANEVAPTMSVEELFTSIMSGKFQSDGISRIKKLAPINKLEVKKLEL